MNNRSDSLKNVTLLITHYNRTASLERLLNAFDKDKYDFGGIVVSDDASNEFHQEQLGKLRDKYSFHLVSTPVNKGLGNNINKGQDMVKTPLTLYVQEDFVPKAIFHEKIITAIRFMNERPNLDMVRFYAYFKYPYLKPYMEGFSEMLFRVWYKGYRKFYFYSDHPHLRRSDFFKKFGRYEEGLKVEAGEYRMMMSFLKKKGTGLFYDDFQALFDQANSSVEPSTVKRNFWRNSNNTVITATRDLYRHLKFNFDYIR